MGNPTETGPVRVAVVTGRHPFDVLGFHALFRSFPDADCYIQHMEDYASTPLEVRQQYDVVVFYNMHMLAPAPDAGWWESGTVPALGQLGETGQGILVLHHALLAFPDLPLWAEVVGIEDRRSNYHLNQTLRVDVADPDHPITRGLSSWEMPDETYTMANAGASNHVLLTTDHQPSMHTLAWTRAYRNARVFCYESGHDNRTFVDPNFRTVVGRGIQWCAGRI